MKKALILLAFTSSVWSTQAQETPVKPEQKTFFGNDEKPSLRGFIGFKSSGILIDNQFGYLNGAEVNLVFNHKLNIGFYGLGMLNNVSYYDPMFQEQRYYNLAVGGFKVEPVIWSYSSRLHLILPMNFGAGAISSRSQTWYDADFNWEDSSFDVDGFVFFEPGAGIELNLLKHVRLAANVGYMFTDNVYLSGNANRNLNSFSGNISLRLGWF